MRHYSFKPGWRDSLALALALLVFVNLGFWQLRRAEEKSGLVAERERRGKEPIVRLTGLETGLDDLRYRRVEVSGRFDGTKQFLVDNQVHSQAPGYHVLTPLRIAGSARAVLVNRGWVPLGPDRNRHPDLTVDGGETRIAGVADRFFNVGFRLKGAEIPGPGWPAVVQVPEPELLSTRIGYPLLPYQVLLDPDADQGFVRDWREARLDPEKNRGYALQWFLFAAVAAVIYLRRNVKIGGTLGPP